MSARASSQLIESVGSQERASAGSIEEKEEMMQASREVVLADSQRQQFQGVLSPFLEGEADHRLYVRGY